MNYLPIVYNANLFLDPELTDEQKIIIALAQTFRAQIQYETDEEKRNLLAKSITASKFATARGVSRDHVRRELRKMQNLEAVKKYVSIYFVKAALNQEDIIVFHFKDSLPDSIEVKDPKIKQALEKQQKNYQWYEIELLKSYLKDSILFHNYNPYLLLDTTNVEVNELIKALIYTENMYRKNNHNIRNPIGYLCSCFDNFGKFKYNVKLEYLPKNYEPNINSNIEYELTQNDLIQFDELLNEKFNNKCRLFYRRDNDKIYLKKIMRAGRYLNPKTWLKKFEIDFKIVNNNLEEQ